MHKSSRHQKHLTGILAGVLLALNATAFAADKQVGQNWATAPVMVAPPKIDGVIHEDEWADAARVEGLGEGMNGPTEVDPRDSVFWITTDGKSLYVAVKSITPPEGKLLTRVKPAAGADVISAYRDDNLELWIAPHLSKDSGDRRMFQIMVNANSAKYDIAFDPFNKEQEKDVKWDSGCVYSNSIVDGWWHQEMAIPFSSLGAVGSDLSGPWGLRIIRNFRRPDTVSGWGSYPGSFTEPSTFDMIQWIKDGVFVRNLSLRDPLNGSVQIGLELVNRSKEQQSLRLRSVHKAVDSQLYEKDDVIVLASGERKRIDLKAAERRGVCSADITVSSPDGNGIYFRRVFSYRIDRPDSLWTISEDDVLATLFDIAYYPYHNKLKARLDISGFRDKDAIKGASLRVKAKADGKEVGHAVFGAFHKNESEVICSLPELSDGVYVVEAVLEGVKTKDITREFTRRHFEWEKNFLGIITNVIPPFTPLVVQDKTVSSVLRSHRMNDLGLWDQVTSEGKDLLSAPMRFEVKINGKAVKVEPEGKITFEQPGEAEVHAMARWHAGSVTGVMYGTWEMDGFYKVKMELEGDGQTPLDQLDLVIPLKNDLAPLMHACPDRAHNAYTGAAPLGEGLVWDSRKGNQVELPGTFLSYIWLGNERQGVCWCADSDQGWLVDDKAAAVEVHRDGGTILLKIRFVTRSAPISGKHTIVFAFQATPTKPLATKPVHWRKWVFESKKKMPNTHAFSFLVGGRMWGTLTAFSEVYPRDKDFTIYNLIAETRRTGKADAAAWEAYMAGFGPEKDNRMRQVLPGTIARMRGQPDVVMPYTNARGSNFGEEFQVFQDEWLLSAYTRRKWSTLKTDGVEYDVSPVRSYQDFCLWYFKKMLESGAMDGIYFDCTYAKANFDIVAGGAYYDDNRKLRPAVDLFAMREHLKRTAILCHQMGKPWYNFAHMTTAQIIPINTWAAVNLSWEIKYGATDFQDRFSRDFIRTETIGLQSGCVPVVLGTVGTLTEKAKEKQRWLHRTLLGVCLVHELKDDLHGYQSNDLFTEIYQHLYEFGYGTDACTVHTYWEKDFPVSIKGVDAEAFLLHKNGEAMVVVTSFDESGDCHLTLDGAALGLPKDGVFVNLESGRKVESDGKKPYTCVFPLPKHDFRLLHFRKDTTK